MLSGMLMVSGEMCGCTGFTGDSGASRFSFLVLVRAVKVILMLVLGNLKVHLGGENTGSEPAVLEEAGDRLEGRGPPSTPGTPGGAGASDNPVRTESAEHP